MINQAPFHEDV